MSVQVLLALLLAFNDMHTPESELKEFARVLSKLPREQAIEAIAVAIPESSLRNLKKPNRADCVCWLQQQCGAKHDKPSCARMVQTQACVDGFVEDMKYWKYHCGRSYLDAYNGGWKKCKSGRYYAKHQADPNRKWCTGANCTSYSKKVRKAEREIRQWLAENEHKVKKGKATGTAKKSKKATTKKVKKAVKKPKKKEKKHGH